jgi:hypothetical protein
MLKEETPGHRPTADGESVGCGAAVQNKARRSNDFNERSARRLCAGRTGGGQRDDPPAMLTLPRTGRKNTQR